MPLVATLATAVACGGIEEGNSPTESDLVEPLGEAEQALVDCGGDDSNALAASLAVAMANELGRWDASTDFEIRDGKLELSATGQLHCAGKCPNINALLRLQDDVSSIVNNHHPATYRTKLTTWYTIQRRKLTQLVTDMLTVDKGVYRFKNRNSGRYLMVDNGSIADEAAVEQRFFPPLPGADQWRVVLEDTKHRFVNVRSGKCLALSRDSAEQNLALVQRPCSTTDPNQHFDFAQFWEFYAISTRHLKMLAAKQGGIGDDVPVVQDHWNLGYAPALWFPEKVGGGPSLLNNVATAMYYLVDRRGGKAISVDNRPAGQRQPGRDRSNLWFERDTEHEEWCLQRRLHQDHDHKRRWSLLHLRRQDQEILEVILERRDLPLPVAKGRQPASTACRHT